MASKQVTDRQKGADAVAAVAEAQVNALAQAVSQVVPSGNTQSLEALVLQLQKALLASRDRMVRADAEHEHEIADDPAARNARDEAAGVLTAKIVELREVLTGLYGNATTQEVLRQATPQDPVVLSRFAVEVSDRLLATTLPAPRVAGTQLDKQAIAQDIRAAQAKLKASLDNVTRELREAQVTLNEKNKALEEYDRIFRGVATTLAGLFTLAGEEALASKVRPSLRRPGRTQDQEDAEPQSPPASSS